MTSKGNLDNCVGVAADANTFYMHTGGIDVVAGHGNKIVAFGLSTGKYRWSAAGPGGQTAIPVRTEGGKLVMYVEAMKGKGGGIATLPSTGGTPPRFVLRHPVSGVDLERGFYEPRITYAGGRTFLSRTRVSGEKDGGRGGGAVHGGLRELTDRSITAPSRPGPPLGTGGGPNRKAPLRRVVQRSPARLT